MSAPAAEETFVRLTDCLERLAEAWECAGAPPRLAEFLPPESELRFVTLVELIKLDLEYRWLTHNAPRRISEYLAEFPELSAENVPVDLLYEEFHIRQQSGLKVDPQEYFQQFPRQASELRCLLKWDAPYCSTQIMQATGKPRLDEIDVGQTLEDFELLIRLGRGGFARVFLARQRSMQRLVAVKISADQGAEGQTLAQLDHDHIVRVYDQRILPEKGLRLLYMQYLPGGTLQQVIELLRETPPEQRTGAVYFQAVDRALDERGESRPVESDLRRKLAQAPWPEVVCWIGSRLAGALAYAHRRGVLHRDIKPANVLISADGAPKLADFNISFSSKLEGVSPAAHFGGSFAYMSPEHLEAFHPGHIRQPDSLDLRCDIFSLGVLLWELLCGRRPFADDVPQGNWSQVLSRMIDIRRSGVEPHALAQLPSQTPTGLKRVLLKCLAPHPADRWSSGEELALQLELCGLHETEELLFPSETTWRVRLRPLAVPLIVAGAAVPNLLAARFNWLYNRKEIVERLSPMSLERFDQIQLVINAIAFPLGLGLLGYLAQRVIRGWKRLAAQQPPQGDLLARTRTACLRLGHWAALIGVSEWTVAGVAYPLSLHLAAGAMPPRDYPHFFFSLLLCGLLASAYPFFLVTLIQVTSIYPALLQLRLPAVEDRSELQRLSRLAWGYLLMAVLVPMLSLTALVGIGSQARYALAVLSAGGLVGCGLAFWLFRKLQADVDALLPATGGRQV